MAPARDLERDLKIAEAITADLKDYLLSDVLYMELPRRGMFGQQYPHGSVGGLVFRLDMLLTLRDRLSPEQQARFQTAREKANDLLHHWAVQVEQKAVREIGARLRTWANFLEDSDRDARSTNSEYAVQVESRVIIEYLRNLVGSLMTDELRDQLNAADRRLNRGSGDGDFVWDAALQDAFPEDRFPWLYLHLR
jgi:hypothetical protein